MRLHRSAAALLATALAVPGLAAADGDDVVGTAAFERLDVTAGAGTIEITGSATFGGEEIVIGTDDEVDGVLVGAGTDIVAMRVSQDPSSGDLLFAMDTDLAAGASAPVVTWSLPFGGGELNAPQLLAFANDATGAPGTFHFKLGTGGGISGNGGDFDTVDVNGRVEGSTLIWEMPPTALGLEPGDIIVAGAAPAYTAPGFANAAVVGIAGNRLDEAIVTESFGVGGGARVKVLDLAGETVDTGVARVRRGEFSLVFSDLAPGTYDVVVSSPYADTAATETVRVTVA